ncbi:hypothetical protein GCM10029976_017380 [Kribbella albertanoniae]|uniref:hypothetical protein n=1 Tax=Kribbella albertanoniae TaxID=1266829 RepID=UPI00192D9736|nr:hypothetical protein [Kribbella albertanoniae]
MPGKLLATAALALVATALTTSAVPTVVRSSDLAPLAAAQVATEAKHADETRAGTGHGTSVADLGQQPAAALGKLLAPPPGGWSVPSRRSYYLTSSCQPYASTIRSGAAAWAGMTEGSGTPVECRNTYINDCNGAARIVGCNWGQGQRIALYLGGVRDGALLAAHEFGHDWYGHSSYRCASWSSAQTVMAPTMC